jgi:hypothetical protein
VADPKLIYKYADSSMEIPTADEIRQDRLDKLAAEGINVSGSRSGSSSGALPGLGNLGGLTGLLGLLGGLAKRGPEPFRQLNRELLDPNLISTYTMTLTHWSKFNSRDTLLTR